MKNVLYQTTPNYTTIRIDNYIFRVANHWFWKQFSEWEPETVKFYETYCIPGTTVLDIGAWIGPTALIALACGAQQVTLVEPNPATLEVLEHSMQLDGILNDKFNVLPYCVSDKVGTIKFGMPDGSVKSSSAASTRGTGSLVNAITIPELINIVNMSPISLVKIDIEGTEEAIITALPTFNKYNVAIWLSLHPPFMDNTELFAKNICLLFDHFHVIDAQMNKLTLEQLQFMILSKDKNPTWGTSFGNFFEIGLLPKQYFNTNGIRETT